MAKILTTLTLLLSLCVGQMWGDTNRVVYCAISDATKGSYTLMVNANIGDNNTWRQYTMTVVSGKTFNGKKVYTATVSEKYGGVDALQFQLYSGDTWQGQKEPISSWTTYSSWAGKICEYEAGTNGTIYTYTPDTYYLEGNTSWISSGWNANNTSKMTDNGDYTWSKTVTSLANNDTWHVMKIYGSYKDDGTIWRGVDDYVAATHPNITATQGDDNFEFKPALSTSSVTVTYNALTGKFSITCAAPTITFDREGGSGGPASQNTYYNEATSSITAPTKSYHDFGGYWTGDDGTGTQVIGTNGAWIKNVSNFTDNSSTAKWIVTANYTLHAKWTPKNYSITYKDQGNVSYSGSNEASLPSSYTYGTGIATLTDGVKSGYRFDGWFANSSCTGDPVTTISTSANGNKIFYAKWTENPGGTITLTAGTGGRVSTDNSTWGTSKSHTGIKTTTPLNIYAQANSGYTFNTWTKTSGSGTITTNAASGVFTPVANADAALTASFTEIKYTVNVALADASQSGGTTDPNGDVSVGAITPVTITAPLPATGYRSTGRWTTTGGVTVADATANPTTITATSAGTVRWTFDEDLTCSWYVNSDASSPFTGWGTSGNRMQKKSGHSTEEIYYKTLTITTPGDYGIKMYNDAGAGNKYYQDKNNSGTSKSIDVATCNGVAFALDNADAKPNMTFKAYLAGDYEFKLDNTGSSPTLTITWPEINQVRISGASPSDATNTDNFDLSAPISNVRSKTLSLNANTTYTFKIVSKSDWYGYNSGTFTRSTSTSSNSRTLSTSGGDMTLTTDYAGDYTFKFNESTKELSIDFPEAYKIHFERGAINGGKVSSYPIATQVETSTSVTSDVTWVKAGNTVTLTAAEVKDGGHYIWFGWYTVQDPDRANPTTNRLGTSYAYTTPAITSASNKNFYAIYFETEYWVDKYIVGQGSVSPSEGQNAYVETPVSFTAAPGTGYKFDNWTQRSGALTIASPTNTTTNVNATAASVLQANFSPRWSVIGTGAFGGWTAYDAHKFDNYAVVSTKDVGYNTITLAANTSYEIKIYDRQTSTTYGGSTAQTIDYSHSGAVNEYTVATTSSPQSVVIQSAAGGSYTLNWNLTDKKIAVVYPTSRYITTGQKTTGQDDNAGGSFTAVDNSSNNVKGGKFVANNATVTFTATPNTGYNFAGWYSDASCETAYVNGTGGAAISGAGGVVLTLSSITADKTVYAKFTPKNYNVALDMQSGAEGYGSGSNRNETVTYNTTLTTVGSLPTAAQGYAFMGFYSTTGGNGRRFIDPSGNWVTNAGDTISDSKWILDNGITLYAYYKKAKITNIAFTPGNIVAPSATVTVTATIEPTPVGPTTICWRVLYSNDNPLDPQPTFTPVSGATVSFPAHSASGSYKVEATLRKGTGCGGDEIHTFTAPFQVAGDHTVAVQYKCGNTTIKASTSVTGKPLQWTAITAPDIVGYSFSKWVEGDGITIEGATEGEKASATINFKAIYDGKLTDVYTQKRMIYFYNTLSWENVYVYFYKDGNYWDNSKGTGTDPGYYSGSHNSAHKGQMLPVTEGSKIYYFDAEEASIPAGYTNVAFTEKQQDNCWYFYDNNKVVRRGDYQSTTMPLFVPLSDQPAVSKNSGTATYYCEGYWMNYPANSGYTLRIYDTPGANNATGASREFLIPFSEDVKMPLKQEVEVNFSGESWFIIYRNDGKYLEGEHTFKQTDHGDKKITSTPEAGTANKMRLISDGSGIYTFTLTFRGDGGENYDYYLNVDFPAAVGDYRIVYSDNATWSNGAHGAGWYHPSDIIGKNTSETEAKEDTVSFFISHGSSPSMKFQRISAISESAGSYGKITWEDVPSGSITIPTSITASGVYNFIVTQPAGGASISLVKAEPYTGNYYIRTDCAGETKWNNFRSPDHLITYSEYSITHGGYSHYYAHWVQNDDKKNIQFCIANDYSSAISDTLIRENNSDPAWTNINNYIESNGDIKRNANIRFMWNQSTNKVSRAYVDGAQGTGSNNFLYMLSEDNKIRKTDESALDDHKVFFSDNENWIYEANIQAQPEAAIKLLSNWGTSNTITQYFKGSSTTTEKLIDGSGEKWYNIRLLYDFKTNRLVAAMVPTGNIDDPTPIHADVMFIREHQGDIDQLTFTGDGSITEIETAYAVMRFNKWTLNNKEKTGSHNPLASPASIYERSLYYVSFPFRVKLSEVFGFGTYGQHWIIQRYRGDLRAQTGWWEGQPGFWEFIWNRNGEVYLEPNQGYILTLETELLGETSDVWGPNSRSSQIELFFPSYGKLGSITNTSITQNVPAHKCTINRAETEGLPDTSDPSTSYNRTIFDSHWNIMSVPTYVNANNPSLATTTWLANDSCPKFLYTWNPDDNTLTATSGTGFMYHAMHAYTVQYYGNVTWTTSVSPAAAPQRNTEYRGEYEFCLEVQQDEQMIDRTFIRLSDDENVTTGFEFGEDMTKQFNSRKANIFTIAGNTSLGGNSLPLSTTQTTIVPVGVVVKKTGDYTFSIPDGTNGIGITLIDEETGIRTSLSALDYTVNLAAGDYTNRFWLEISPIHNAPTGIEEVSGNGLPTTEARKVLIDGILYIVKDGQLFDATGKRVE